VLPSCPSVQSSGSATEFHLSSLLAEWFHNLSSR
jgi:hypothetical protein